MNKNLIQSDPAVLMGKPVIAGTRITVELILEKLGAGACERKSSFIADGGQGFWRACISGQTVNGRRRDFDTLGWIDGGHKSGDSFCGNQRA